LYGDGWVKWFKLENKVKAERKHALCMMVDPHEALYGKPRQLFERSYISKQLLKTLYPKMASAIEEASPVKEPSLARIRSTGQKPRYYTGL
jgi:hypothetical protein